MSSFQPSCSAHAWLFYPGENHQQQGRHVGLRAGSGTGSGWWTQLGGRSPAGCRSGTRSRGSSLGPSQPSQPRWLSTLLAWWWLGSLSSLKIGSNRLCEHSLNPPGCQGTLPSSGAPPSEEAPSSTPLGPEETLHPCPPRPVSLRALGGAPSRQGWRGALGRQLTAEPAHLDGGQWHRDLASSMTYKHH